MTPSAKSMNGGSLVSVSSLARQILSEPEIEGITITGGEPFLQANQLSRLIDGVRVKSNLGVIVYTGYTLEELRAMEDFENGEAVAGLLGRVDVLIDGPYVKELDDGLSLRGSSNQVAYSLTDRYGEGIHQYYGQPKRNAEFHLLEDEVFLVGIPGKEVFNRWKERRLFS